MHAHEVTHGMNNTATSSLLLAPGIWCRRSNPSRIWCFAPFKKVLSPLSSVEVIPLH